MAVANVLASFAASSRLAFAASRPERVKTYTRARPVRDGRLRILAGFSQCTGVGAGGHGTYFTRKRLYTHLLVDDL